MDPNDTIESRHTAVIWIDPAQPAPFELLTALSGRGIHSVRVSSPYMGLAEVCRIYRARLKERPDKPLANVLALVVVNPGAEPRTGAVYEALERYAGHTPCWMYGPVEAPKLRPINETDLASWRGDAPELAAAPRVTKEGVRETPMPSAPAKLVRQPRGSAPGAPPPLRLAGSDAFPSAVSPPAPKGHDRNADADDAESGGGTEASRSVLSPEELSMLLGDDDGADR